MATDIRSLIPKIRRSTTALTPVFILSHGRSGTKWLAWAIQKMCSGVIAAHEPPPMIKLLALQYYYRNISDKEALEGVKLARNGHIYAAAKYFKASHYVEVNRNLFSLAEPLREAYPRAKIIGLVRDGRKFLVSMLNKNFYGEDSGLGKGGGKPYLEGQFPRWGGLSQVEKIAYHWVMKINAFVGRECEQVDYLYRIEDLLSSYLSFEEFVYSAGKLKLSEGEDTFYKLRSKKVNVGDSYKINSFNELSDKDKTDFYRIAGSLLGRLGY